ncbi:MAG TPA: urea carboxylase-associated family protein [Steroidobacteraceae bacterium]|jgi:hypothetical protein
MAIKTIEAGTGEFVALKAGQTLRLIDPQGGQSGDLMAYRDGDITEWLSNGRTFDYAGTIYLTTGHTLYSNKSNPMLAIVRDDVGRHDFLYASCSLEMYRRQYGSLDHRNCLSNIVGALAHLGVKPHLVPTAFNFFMNARVGEDGRLAIMPPLSKSGDLTELRAEMDLAIAITACPSLTCNGGAIKPVQYSVD